MSKEAAATHALGALTYILAEDSLRDRFIALSGMSSSEIKDRLEEADFLASILDFLISHEPDLIAYAEHSSQDPAHIVTAWRQLGGGVGQEW